MENDKEAMRVMLVDMGVDESLFPFNTKHCSLSEWPQLAITFSPHVIVIRGEQLPSEMERNIPVDMAAACLLVEEDMPFERLIMSIIEHAENTENSK